MDDTPLITILIPTYNRADYLREAIRSALGQTYSPLEILVLDNVSEDHTPEVVAEFARVPHLRYIRQETNTGITGNWRRGIQEMRGEYFCLLHDDDTLEPEFIADLARPLQADRSLVVSFCDHRVVNAEGLRLAQETETFSARSQRRGLAGGRVADFARSALIAGSLCAGAALFRRSQITPDMIREEAKGAIDFWLFYQCVKTGGGAYYVPERLMNYRVHAGGMSGSEPQYMGEGHIFRQRAILADPAMRAIHADTRRLLAGTLTAQGIDQLTHGQAAEARATLRQSLRLHPSRRALLAYARSWGGS